MLRSLLQLKKPVHITLRLEDTAMGTEDLLRCVKPMFLMLGSLVDEGYKVVVEIEGLEVEVVHGDLTEEYWRANLRVPVEIQGEV